MHSNSAVASLAESTAGKWILNQSTVPLLIDAVLEDEVRRVLYLVMTLDTYFMIASVNVVCLYTYKIVESRVLECYG